MSIEIEKKFLLKSDKWKDNIVSQYKIKQGYLNSVPEATVRVRTKGDKGYITIKGKRVNIKRLEFEYEIPYDDAEELLLLCEKPIIIKTRFNVRYEDALWEIDVFENENEGLCMAEIELESESDEMNIPDWIGEEVTHDNKYYNSNLIHFPFNKW